jgi:hypothetical protein
MSDKAADNKTVQEISPERKARIDRILQHAIDPHVHSGPSIAKRSLDHLELVQQMSAAGFDAVVTKDHDYAGTATAQLITKHFPELRTKIFSSIVLNNAVGGMNPYAVEHTAAMGGKIVWMPTLAAENHLRWEKSSTWVHPASTQKMRAAAPIPVIENGKVRDDVKEVLDVVAKNDMILASGHIHVSETWLVFEEAQKRGVKKLVFTHPEDIVGASLNDVKGIAAMGAAIEHSLAMFVGRNNKLPGRTPEDLRRQIDAGGVDNTIMCSDLGQMNQVSPLEGFQLGVDLCMDLGYSDADIHKMVSTNTARVLGLAA